MIATNATLTAWRRASDRDLLAALTNHRSEYTPDVLAIILQVARERDLILEALHESGPPTYPAKPIKPAQAPPDPFTKYFAAALTLALWLATWPQILPKEADLPPCHMMLLIAIAGLWTVHLVGRDLRYKRRQRAAVNAAHPYPQQSDRS